MGEELVYYPEYLSSSRPPLAHKAETNEDQSSRLLAIRSRSFHVFPSACASASRVRLHVILGRPLRLLPSGVQRSATFTMPWSSLLKAWPAHLHLLSVIIEFMPLCLVIVSRSLLVTFWGQNILHIFLRQPVWKADSFAVSAWVILQHSAPYNSTDNTQLL